MSCDKCAGHPELKEKWGCNDSLQLAVEKFPDDHPGRAVEYFNCPVLFVTPNVTEFSRRYHAIKNGFAAAPAYEDEMVWFNNARLYYESWRMYFVKRKKDG